MTTPLDWVKCEYCHFDFPEWLFYAHARECAQITCVAQIELDDFLESVVREGNFGE